MRFSEKQSIRIKEMQRTEQKHPSARLHCLRLIQSLVRSGIFRASSSPAVLSRAFWGTPRPFKTRRDL